MLDASEQGHAEELFGPAEGLQATYRMIQDEVLEEAWRAGGKLSRAAPRHLHRRQQGGGPVPRAGEARGADPAPRLGAGRRGARPRQRPARARDLAGAARRRSPTPGSTSTCSTRRARAKRRRELIAAARRALAGGLPAAARRGPGPFGDRHRALPDLPAQVQVRAGLRDPPGDDDQPALRDRHPPGPRALPRPAGRPARRDAGSLERLMAPVRRRLAALGLRRVRRRAPVPRARDRGPAPLPRPRSPQRREPPLGRAQVRLPDRPPPPARPGRPGRRASGRRLRADRLQDRRPEARARAGGRRPAGDLPARRARGLAARRSRRQLLVRARRREGRGRRLARRPRAGRGSRARGRRGHPRPGLRAPALARDLLLVRLPADLPGV